MNKFFLSYFLLLQVTLWGVIDIEANIQTFVLETQKIEIPHNQHGFNPSILEWNDQILMSFRCIPDKDQICESSSSSSEIRLVQLNKNFEHPTKVQTLVMPDTWVQPEDARLITINKRLYIVYSGKGSIGTSGGFRVYVAELIQSGEEFKVVHNECLEYFEGADINRREKNWVAFNHKGNLMLAYGLSPHKILLPLLDGSGVCETVCTTEPLIHWEWGELRGGTPAIKINNDQYLAFFHSSIPLATVHSQDQEMPHYFMGAYTFSKEPPFAIQQISPKPIVGKDFYHGEVYTPYWHPVRVVFPCGFIHDEKYIWVSYGRQDHEIWIAKLDKQGLLDSLVTVKN